LARLHPNSMQDLVSGEIRGTSEHDCQDPGSDANRNICIANNISPNEFRSVPLSRLSNGLANTPGNFFGALDIQLFEDLVTSRCM
jgi:hypothetical protein